MTEREMEKLFKSKLSNREFAFNPGNWDKMETMLDQKATAGGGYFWRSAAAILLFGAIVASVLYYNPGLTTRYDGISGPDFLPDGNRLPNIEFGTDVISNQPNSGSATFEEAKNEMTGNSAEKQWPETNVGRRTQSIASSNAAPLEGEATTTQTTKPEINSMVNPDESELEGLTNTMANSATIENFEPLDFVELLLKDYVLPELASQKFNVKDAALVGYGEETPPQRKINTNGVFVNGGPVFTGSNTNNTLGTGFLAGIGYRRALNYGFGVETGLNYFVLNNVNIQNHSDSVFYRFGKERIKTEELNSRLDYLEVPLNLTYKLAPKHQLGVGGYASILLNVSRDITRTTYTPKSGTFVEGDKVSGYLDEFNRFDFGLNAFYRYSVSSRLNVGLHFKQGLLDITHDVSEGYSEDHKNFNTRIVLEYSLF